MNLVTKAIIPVAGKGTRFLPATKSVAKEMFPIVDIPALMLVLQECMKSGIKEVLIVLCKGKENIIDFLQKNENLEKTLKKCNRLHLLDELNEIIENIKIDFVYQSKEFSGSAMAVWAGKEWAENKPFAVLYPDDLNYTEDNKLPAIGQLIEAYNKYKCMIIGCKEIPKDEIYKYSACKIEEKINDSLYKINQIVEKPAKGTEPSNISGLARYVMPANTFDYIEKQLKTANKDIEVGLTDTMDMILKDSPTYAVIMDSVRYDTGDKLGYLIATVEYGLRHKELGEKFKNYIKTLKL